MPEFVQRELEWGFRRAFPERFRIPGTPKPTWLNYIVQPFAMVEPEDGITARQLNGWIEIGDQPVGMIQTDEWTPLPGVTDWSFFDACDGWSQETADFGDVVFARWKIRRLQKIGRLVELSKVWMLSEHGRRRLWTLAVQELIRRRHALWVRFQSSLSHAADPSPGSAVRPASPSRPNNFFRIRNV